MSAFPIVILEDRYNGAYSGGVWLAIARAGAMDNGSYRIVRCLEDGPHGGDTEAMLFWAVPPDWIAAGNTPDHALANLRQKLKP